MAKSMGMGKFRPPPTDPKPLIRFRWNSNLRTTIWRPPTMQDFVSIRQRGWSRRIASLPLLGLFLCLFWSLRHAHRSHPWTDFDNLYFIWRLSAQGCAFWGSRWCASPFRASNPPQNPNFGGVNRRFPAKLLKSKNMHIIKTTASIPTKFFAQRSDKDHQMPFAGGPNTHVLHT